MREMGRAMLRMATAAVIGLAVAQAANAAEMTGAGATFAAHALRSTTPTRSSLRISVIIAQMGRAGRARGAGRRR